MDLQLSPASAVAEELGSRLKQARLNKNLTQQEIADKLGVARKTIVLAEQGHTRFETFVAIMQALQLTDHLDVFLPKQEISPIQLAKMQGKKRRRASGQSSDDEETPTW